MDVLYPETSKKKKCLIIGVCGASGSGKTTFCNLLGKALKEKEHLRIRTVSSDCYYKGLPHLANADDYDFDTPDALDFGLLAKHLKQIEEGEEAAIPQYDFTTHSRLPAVTKLTDVDVLLVEGILIFCAPELKNAFSLRLFITEDEDVCLARRIKRDIEERGRTADTVIDRYLRFVKPSYSTFVSPFAKGAHLIIPNAGRNEVALEIVLHYASTHKYT